MFDLLVADVRGYAIPIQVKAINGPSWQFSADKFLRIKIVDGEQRIMGKVPLPNPELLCIFVLLKGFGKDEFYIFPIRELQDHFARRYKGRRRPKNPLSLHCAIWPKELSQFRDKWDLLKDNLERVTRKVSTA